MAPQYSSLICLELVMSTKRWSIFSCGTVSWLTQILASARSPKQAPSAETLFSHQKVTSTGFDELWSRRVPRCDCMFSHLSKSSITIQPWERGKQQIHLSELRLSFIDQLQLHFSLRHFRTQSHDPKFKMDQVLGSNRKSFLIYKKSMCSQCETCQLTFSTSRSASCFFKQL